MFSTSLMLAWSFASLMIVSASNSRSSLPIAARPARREGRSISFVPSRMHQHQQALQLDKKGQGDTQQGAGDDTVKENNNHIVVSTEIELPFKAEIAFDAFSDLPRQPSWSPWLKSVSYLDSPDVKNRETKWTMRYLGISLAWNCIHTQLERPYTIAWKSTKGLKNSGRVEFLKVKDSDSTIMKLTMTFVAPSFAARMCRRSSAIEEIVKNRMLNKTLVNFRDIVMEHDLKLQPPSRKNAQRGSPQFS